MTRKRNRVISGVTGEALGLLAARIKAARLERRLPAREVAERAGISRDLLSRIERADPACGIGVVFEVASLVGVELFHADAGVLARERARSRERLALLPRRARRPDPEVDDDF